MPLVAPVITATLPSSRPIVLPLFWQCSGSVYPRLAEGAQAMHVCLAKSGFCLVVPDCVLSAAPCLIIVMPYFGFADRLM
jgi:hypothetical protein